jgi:hypothetical protein
VAYGTGFVGGRRTRPGPADAVAVDAG